MQRLCQPGTRHQSAVLRRTYDFGASAPLLGCRGAVLDTGDNTLRYEGNTLELSRNEYRILQVLLEQKMVPIPVRQADVQQDQMGRKGGEFLHNPG